MFNLEGIIPKLCQLALEGDSNDGAPHLRSAGLQSLASMVLFYLSLSLPRSDANIVDTCKCIYFLFIILICHRHPWLSNFKWSQLPRLFLYLNPKISSI